MDTILGFLASAALIVVYAWVIGTVVWMLFVVPRMHKRQTEILRRLGALEARIDAAAPREVSRE